MTRQQLIEQISLKQSFLCVGLDTDLDRIPRQYIDAEDPVLAFNQAIIEATKEYCVAYKPNFAFYEAQGVAGWNSLERTIELIPDDTFIIADAKRGDIGNTSRQYARAVFEHMGADAITVAPYMGEDSITPFLGFDGKWVIVLGLTSNPGSQDFQMLETGEGYLFEKVMKRCAGWGSPEEMMFVAGATQGPLLQKVRQAVPEHFLLVPGVGAQGGSLQQVADAALTNDCSLLVNASRSIIYAGDGPDYAEKAGEAARALQEEMAEILRNRGVLQG